MDRLHEWVTFRAMGLIAAVWLLGLTGCQYQAVSSVELQIHQSQLSPVGLTPVQTNPDLKITCEVPDQWDKLPINKTLLYTHQQWRSTNKHVGMGVAYIHTPIPLSAGMIIWFAKQQYSNGDNEDNGRLIGEWTDALGRSWFEAENDLYHVKGYAMTSGFDAWIVYSGYRVLAHPTPAEIAIAAKAADSVAPMTMQQQNDLKHGK